MEVFMGGILHTWIVGDFLSSLELIKKYTMVVNISDLYGKP